MKTLKITALFMIVLLINSTLIYGDLSGTIQDPKDKLDEAAEALSDSQETDIIINVDSYLPTVLAEQAFESDQPGGYLISATLTGVKTNPLMDLQKIDRINVRPAGGSTKYVKNIYYKKPTKGYFSLDNLGYIAIRLKKIKEDEVPKRLDINMTADITYRIQNGFGVNEQDLILPVLNEEEFLQRRTEFGFYGGRGYIRLADIRGDTAYFIVYDGDLTKNSFSAKQSDKPSAKQFLSGGNIPYLLFENPEDFIGRNSRNSYSVKVNQISGNKDTAKIEMIFNGEYKLKEFVEGQALYPGSKWKLNDIKTVENYDEVEFVNTETREKLLLKGGNFVYAFEGTPKDEPPEATILEIPKEIPNGDDIINPGDTEQVNKWIEEYSSKYRIDPNFVKGLYANEGVFRMQWNGYAQKVLDDKLPGWKNEPVTLKNLLEQQEIVWYNKVYFDKQGMHYDEDKGKRYTAYGYGQFVKTTAAEKSYFIFGEKNSNNRFYPDRNIELTVYYLKELGLTKDSSESEKIKVLRVYTGGSGGDKHIDNILNSEKEYESGKKKFTVGGKEYAQAQSGASIEVTKAVDEFLQDYKIIHSNFSILIERDNIEEIEGLESVLEDYNIFLDKVNDQGDEKLFNKYRSLILKDLTDLRYHYANNNEISDKIIATITSLNLQLKPSVIKIEKKDEIIEGSSDYYFNKAIENYRTVVDEYPGSSYGDDNNKQDLAMQAQLKIAEIYDLNLKDNDKAIEEYTNLINKFDYPEKNIIENRIKFLEIGRGYFSNTVSIFENENALSLSLYNVEKAGVDDTVIISVNGVSELYSLKKDNIADTGWFLKEINEDYVKIVRYEKDKDGTSKEADSTTLKLGKEESPRISGDKNDLKKTFILQKVNLNRKAHVTILPSEEKITTHTTFMLHIPVEPRLWKLTPEQMNKHINATRKLIDGLNRAISTIENIYTIWSYSCYATFAVLWIKNSWFDFGGTKTLARKTVINGWKEECENLATKPDSIYKGDILKCVTDKRKLIDEDVNKAKNIYDSNKDDNERIKGLAKENFGVDRLNKKYDEEVLQVEFNQRIDKFMKDKTTLEDKRNAIISARESILKDESTLKNNYNIQQDTNIFDRFNIKPSSDVSADIEKINVNEIHGRGEKYYRFIGDEPLEIYKNGNKYYKDEKFSKELQVVSEDVQSKPSVEKSVNLVTSGKWTGYIDRLSINSVYYLRVSKRGGDGIPLEAELWGRYSNFPGSKVPLDSSQTNRKAGPFNIEDCRKGSSSDRKDVDIFASLKSQYGNELQEACGDLLSIDRTVNTKNRKPGEKINNYLIQYAVQETGGLQCFDIMDVNDCLILFSVCDPVMCPVSRFTAGGTWKVDNVVSTGIFGSVFLGKNLWRATPIPEVGICVPGIDAGLKNIRSLSEGYEQCMITRRDKGENVGICDTIRSIGMCKIAWREGASFIKLSGGVLDSILGTVMPQASGGGEYAYFQSNIQETGNFLNFFTKEYATTYFSAYRGASTDEIGEELCKAAIYGKFPGVGNLINKLTKPEGPVQFIGWFTEIPNNDLAGQLLSDYEIYYHIYAGEDREQIKYYVYLKDLDDLSRKLYITKTTGYLNKGDFVDETVRRTEPTGYDELCIVVDNQEHCGFQRVSSYLSLDIYEDYSLEKDARNKNIQTEQECTGESTVLSDPGISSAVDALYPRLLNNGLIRVCSAENPGKGVDNSTWVEVGNCGQNNLKQELGKCWLNKRSYKDSLSVYDSKRREEAEKFFKELGAGELLGDEEIRAIIIELMSTRNSLKNTDDATIKNYKIVIKELENLNSKTINFDLAGKMTYETGETYYELALYLGRKEIKESPSVALTDIKTDIKTDKYKIIFEFQDGTVDTNLLYKYDQNQGWLWSFADDIWMDVSNNPAGTSERNTNFIKLMTNVKNNYIGGLTLLISRTINNKEWDSRVPIFNFMFPDASLVTNNVELDNEGIFTVKEKYFIDKKEIYFRFMRDTKNNVNKWEWSFNKKDWNDVIKSFNEKEWSGFSSHTQYLEIINQLKTIQDFDSGAMILFDIYKPQV